MERIDDLEFDGLKIIQNTDGFCFGIDSVLLANFAANDMKKKLSIADLGTGTGVLSLLVSKKADAKHIVAFEKQAAVADMAKRSIKLNSLESIIDVKNIDIIDLIETSEYKNAFDVVITNPPYKKEGTGIYSENDAKQISRYESSVGIYNWVKVSRMILKDKGTMYMVYRPERLSELFEAFAKNNIEPKTIKFVHSKIDENSKLVLVKAIKGANKFLIVDKPMIIYNEDGTYTKELLEFCSKKR